MRKLCSPPRATTGAVLTLEEHSIVGGLGSAVAELFAEQLDLKVAI